MDLTKIVRNSFKYSIKNIVKLPIIGILFILMAFVPIGRVLENNYVVFIGVVGFFLFLLIVPGYFLNIVKKGSMESSLFPSFNLVNNIYDSIRVLILRAAYMIVPVAVFFIALFSFGPVGMDFINNFQIHIFLATFGVIFLVILLTYLIFEFLLFFAKARLAYLNSLSEALKINMVLRDIKNIGIVNIIKWMIFMAVLMIGVSLISSVVMAIPYVGFLIYIGVVIPMVESIGNYSLGMLYSNINLNN
ncbi:MAG: DUF4013 domain-containing protein [Methanobrevibacter sp.]|uniref:DUF4013 domain-containing protein n=1 Tax=Methanobrevibacter sp. TaxID=66852 RepID=UPI0025CB930F|nr:DUF4013 domain-containing protein [Methanobrevibacter sp.]MBQ8017612.1 DUF4013 domain-containing protein [Methanobrevibacter sp.]